MMDNFTPVPALLGGLLIGASAALFLILNGRIAGISGILGGLLQPANSDTRWRLAFLAGLLDRAPGLCRPWRHSPARRAWMCLCGCSPAPV